MFHRERKSSLPTQKKSVKDLTRIVTANQFLNEEKRQNLLRQMKDQSALEPQRYDSLCTPLIENLIHYCQYLPETINSFYSQPGGLVDYALNRTEAALSLFQEFMVCDEANSFSEEQKLWQYALYSASILQGIGKLFVDYRVSLFDINGQLLKEWNPLLESMSSFGHYFCYKFRKEPEIEFRKRLNLLLAKALMPQSGFTWIASYDDVLAVWLALLNEDERSAGTLGTVLIRADAIAIQRYFTEFLGRHSSFLPSGPYGGIGTFTGGTPESLLEREQNAGLEFIQWMIHALEEGHILVNKSPLFMVPGGMLLCKEMFQLFVREHPAYKSWQAVQNGLIALGLHTSGADGSVISRYEQAGSKQMHSGIVLGKYAIALAGSVSVQHASGKVEKMSALELINRAQYHSQLTQQGSGSASSLQKLNAGGQWQTMEQNNSLRPGAKDGV